MKIYLIALSLTLLSASPLLAQQYKAAQSSTTFYSSTPLEDIKATNKQGTALFNGETGALAFRIPIKGFSFRKSLMQQHFNENYMESDKYPNATFEGKLTGYDLGSQGTHDVEADGHLTIHGVTQRVKIPGKLILDNQGVTMTSKFKVKLEDYDISIPKVVFLNIAEVIDVDLNYQFKEM
ncbi:YceI family protein [Belliella marina]|uniref:YceI family protein n=1 Tax=Belliella marina TaxID=1644146 RepID=A0ABW4VQ64_9BACT